MTKDPSIHHVALWGTIGCGKDSWAATLHLAAEKSGWHLRPWDQATTQWQTNTWQRLAQGDFPQATAPPTPAHLFMRLTFELCSPARFGGRQRTLIQLLLASGEWWTATPQSQPRSSSIASPISQLAYADGIICLLDATTSDPLVAASALITMLESLDRYRREANLRHPIRMALWLTKMDHPQHRCQRGHEERYARTLFGDPLFACLEQYRRLAAYPLRWGGCSAVGSILHQGRLRSNAYWDYSTLDANGDARPTHRILDARAIQPEGVLEPLEWVLEPLLRNRWFARLPVQRIDKFPN